MALKIRPLSFALGAEVCDIDVPAPSTPEEFAAHIKAELKKWGDVAKAANITAD